MSYIIKPSKYIGGSSKKKYWFIPKQIKGKIVTLAKSAMECMDKDLLNRLTLGATLINGDYMYLDRSKYKGRGRPRKSDYTKSHTLYIDKKL